MGTATATATQGNREPKASPPPNSDFYQLVDVLSAEELAFVKNVRTYVETKDTPIINKYWADDAFPFELLAWFKELNIGGLGYEGNRCARGSQKQFGSVAMELARIDPSLCTSFGVPRGTFLRYLDSIDIPEYREIQSEPRRRLLEIDKLNRQADAALLAASIAHEINQPLAAIVANGTAGLRWLARETPDVEEAKATLSDIVQEAQRVHEIIDSLRVLSKKERRVHASFSLNELIQEVLALVEDELQSRDILVQTTLNDALPQVLGDRVQLQQVILNLVNNAIEAMNDAVDGPRVLHIKTELEESKKVEVSVWDSGPGIDAENIERIFERFFTTKIDGMGIGLSICRSIIEAHGGRVWAEATAPRGAVFRISLPTGAS